jgi:hypothetical protein
MEHINRLLAIGKNYEAADLIRKRAAMNLDFGGMHVRCAHTLALECDWDTVTKLLPLETNALKTSGWLLSIATGRPVDLAGQPIPWMNYAAIDFIGQKINANMRVFEWGAGFSSLWFASKVMEVVSVEDNIEWYQELTPQLPENVKIMCLPNEAEYVSSITKEAGDFDVIVIDGSFRNECASMCAAKLTQNGMVIFDNSDGNEFDQSMEYFNKEGFFRIDFWGLIPSYLYKNCTSILFRNADFLKNDSPPSRQVLSTGISCFQAISKANQETK